MKPETFHDVFGYSSSDFYLIRYLIFVRIYDIYITLVSYQYLTSRDQFVQPALDALAHKDRILTCDAITALFLLKLRQVR